MAHQRGAGGGARPRDNVDDALRNAGLQRKLGKAQCRERGLRRRLEHDGAARRQSRRDLPNRNAKRDVPRHDGTHHADGFAEGEAGEFAIREIGDRKVLRGAFDLGRPTGHVAQHMGRVANVDAHRVAQKPARTQRLDLGDFLAVGLEQIGKLQHRRLPLVRAHRPPRPGECLAGGNHRSIDIARGRFRRARKFRAARWVDQRIGVLGSDALAADENPVRPVDNGVRGRVEARKVVVETGQRQAPWGPQGQWDCSRRISEGSMPKLSRKSRAKLLRW